MQSSDAHLERLDELAAELSERLRRGEQPTVAEYATRFPELADEIRQLFPTILALEQVKAHQDRRSDGRATLRGTQLTRLGDFRIVREIGRGGMGIVYEAEQESLGRHVAIKVLPRNSLMSEADQKRFQREAQIAGRLHHTNIVSVFGVGEQDGFHYYVMPLAPGVGLDRVIHRLADQRRTATAIGRTAKSNGKGADDFTIADGNSPSASMALDEVVRTLFSESGAGTKPAIADTPRGVAETVELPREAPQDRRSGLRPDNGEDKAAASSLAPDRQATGLAYDKPAALPPSHWLRVAKIGVQVARALEYAHEHGTIHCDIKPANLLVDHQGHVWVTDFGVAKALQTEQLTRTGDVTGTLHYTAPERFNGQTDGRSDLYSLGLTLQELITLRPAFAETDRQLMLRRIMDGSPDPLRKSAPDVPRDLETIVLKAIARNPNDRYATAGALADDLERFLDDQPILARRHTYWERLVRWRRKNPIVAALAGAVACLLTLIVALVTYGYVSASAANTSLNEMQSVANAQRQKAEATTRVALDVLDRIYTQFAPADSGTGTEARVALSGTSDSSAELTVPLQPALSPETATVLENLLPFYDRLALNGSDNEQLRVEAAIATRRIADIHAHLGQSEKAQAAYRRALTLFEKLASDAPTGKYATEIAGIHDALGAIAGNSGKTSDAMREHREALKILEPLAIQPNAAAGPRFQLARTYYNLGTVIRGANGPLGTAGGGRPGASAGPPSGGPPFLGPPGFPPGGPMAGLPPGFSPPGIGPPGVGPMEFGPSWDDPSGGSSPENRRFGGPPSLELDPPGAWDRNAAFPSPLVGEGSPRSRFSTAPQPTPDDDFANKEDEYLKKAIALLKQLTTEQPAEPDYQHLLACCYRDLARSPHAKSNDAGFQEATKILETLVHDHPQSPAYRFDLISSYARLGRNEPLGRDADITIEQDLRRALKSADELVAQNPAVPSYAALQVPMLQKLAQLQRRAGRPIEAAQALRRAIEVQSNLVERFPGNSVYSQWLAQLRRELADGPR